MRRLSHYCIKTGEIFRHCEPIVAEGHGPYFKIHLHRPVPPPRHPAARWLGWQRALDAKAAERRVASRVTDERYALATRADALAHRVARLEAERAALPPPSPAIGGGGGGEGCLCLPTTGRSMALSL